MQMSHAPALLRRLILLKNVQRFALPGPAEIQTGVQAQTQKVGLASCNECVPCRRQGHQPFYCRLCWEMPSTKKHER